MLSEKPIHANARSAQVKQSIVIRGCDFAGYRPIFGLYGHSGHIRHCRRSQPTGIRTKIPHPDGSNVDFVNHSFNGFPTKTSDEFAQLLNAIGTSGRDALKPTDLDRFLDSHPIAKTFLSTQLPAPASYSTLAYFGVNSFKFVNEKGSGTYIRYRFKPLAGEEVLTPSEIHTRGPNYLSEEILTRVASGPIQFSWYAQISGPGDVIEDPSIALAKQQTARSKAWRTITIDRMIANPVNADKTTPSSFPGMYLQGSRSC